ncbi:C-type lectin domain family 4 member M-like [Drosophila takahashii]|uniref:C-type lectin domain family 4 member M-like n=1 Tax=Drosophila takahashii TaxID=29030 RepID=UPI001CF8DB23|nr:uncharacterized protein LOC108065534 [Drosophila takahashii]
MIYFVPFFFVLNYFGRLSALQDNDSSICLLTDAPNQCGAFCLSALHPLIDDNFHSQVKLDRIEQGVESLKNSQIKNEFQLVLNKMENHKKSMQTKLDAQLLVVQLLLAKMTDQETSMQTKMDAQLLEVNKKLGDQKTAHFDFFEARLNGTEGQLRMLVTKMEAQLKELQNKTENQLLELNNQLSAFQKTLLEIPSTIYYKINYPKFERIGSRYFYIEHDIKKTWDEAAGTCREMGGYLANFKTQEELAAIMPKLHRVCCWYWTGIKHLKEDGKFISTASGKPATAFKWWGGEPDSNGICVMMDNISMRRFYCSDQKYFICQLDNET